MTEPRPNDRGDAAVDVEKPSPTYSATRDTSTSTDVPQLPSDADQGAELNNVATADANKDATDEKADGAALNRVESQAQKLGKSKIIVIMSALCVCLYPLLC